MLVLSLIRHKVVLQDRLAGQCANSAVGSQQGSLCASVYRNEVKPAADWRDFHTHDDISKSHTVIFHANEAPGCSQPIGGPRTVCVLSAGQVTLCLSLWAELLFMKTL